MIRPRHTWAFFGLFVAVALCTMGWLGLTLLRLERYVAQEENVRLSLWRMDSALAPVVATENGRPHFVYQAVYAADPDIARFNEDGGMTPIILPSPLLSFESPYILLHFQVGPGGDLSSPQIPPSESRGAAEAAYTTPERIERASERLANLRSFVSFDSLQAALPGGAAQQVARVNLHPARRIAMSNAIRVQRSLNVQEQQVRLRQQTDYLSNSGANTLWAAADASAERMVPLWVGSHLLLVRRTNAGGSQACIQGCWLDWPAIRSWLKDEIGDLLPDASLKPISPDAGEDPTRTLAALPVGLIPGEVPGHAGGGLTPMQVSLLIAWACIIVSVGAVAALLHGTVSLSERRAAFVSAVTHELRTPLTTLRMCTDMLAGGMVTGEAKRREYLATLRNEANRLGYLVDNVLAYAQLEGNGPGQRLETISLGDLLSRARLRLAERAEQGGMRLAVDLPDAVAEVQVRADPTAVEQILFNLVDNACKYARSASNRSIGLTAGREDALALVRVRDYGPGIPPDYARRLFKPFSRSGRDVTRTEPGVGLGLALSRRLARAMGGDLRHDESVTDGACLVLTLPTP